MKFIGSRDLRQNPTQVWEELKNEEEIILTLNGKPKAILTRTDEAHWEESLRAIRRARAQMAVAKLRCASRKNLSLADINKEIAGARKKLQG